MKVLILGSGRCGTSRLGWCLKEHYNIPFTSEPFNWDYQKTSRQTEEYVVPDNHVIKCLPCYQQYIDPELKTLTHEEDAKERTFWFMDLSLKFDKVILMTRRDLSQRLLSVLHAHKHGTWWDKYTFKPISITEDDKPLIDDFLYTEKVINTISQQLAIPMTYMEDLYTKDIEKSKETWLSFTQDFEYKGENFIEIYEKFFSPMHKQRT
jgi:hypothetical protein